MELSAVTAFLRRVFRPHPLLGRGPAAGAAAGAEGGGGGGSTFGVLPLASSASELDLAEETMETLMSYLQQQGGQGGAGGGEEGWHEGDGEAPAAAAAGAGAGAVSYVSVLPTCAARLDVFFHRVAPAALAARWPVVGALLGSKPRVHRWAGGVERG